MTEPGEAEVRLDTDRAPQRVCAAYSAQRLSQPTANLAHSGSPSPDLSVPTLISFLLNGEPLILPDASPERLLLDFLRRERRAIGTKEGCREGDCGACAVLIGELNPSGEPVYRAVPSCMVLLSHVQGRHVVTIEGLNLNEGLSPVQTAVVNHGGSQCGFCTPGFIVSFTSFLLNTTEFTVEAATNAIAGNLCRCTGYSSLVRAGAAIASEFGKLTAPGPQRLQALLQAGALPSTFESVVEKLHALPEAQSEVVPTALVLGGGTDLIVQRGAGLERTPTANHFASLAERQLTLDADTLRIPGAATFEDLYRSELFTGLWPLAKADLERFASILIRERATVAGNLANASPIADGTALFLALDAYLELDGPQGSRVLPLAELYLGYKQLALLERERITSLCIPNAQQTTRKYHFEKVSKREYLDIATVNSALSIQVEEGKILRASLSAGGVGPTPMLLAKTTAFLCGQALEVPTLLAAALILNEEIAPISDVRGSATYKRLLLRQLFFAHFLALFPTEIPERELMEATR